MPTQINDFYYSESSPQSVLREIQEQERMRIRDSDSVWIECRSSDNRSVLIETAVIGTLREIRRVPWEPVDPEMRGLANIVENMRPDGEGAYPVPVRTEFAWNVADNRVPPLEDNDYDRAMEDLRTNINRQIYPQGTEGQ